MGPGEIAHAEPSATVHFCPPPAWVQHDPYEHDLLSADAYMANGVVRLLHDTQVDLTGPWYAWHCRTVQRVQSRAGAEQASHFVIEFDPSYQRLEVHFIRVVRGEQAVEHAEAGQFQVFRRETNLERLVLNGRLTASLLVPDVREGDVLEIALTLYGNSSALGGKYASWVSFDVFNPWFDIRHRLLKPLARKIEIKSLNGAPERKRTVAGDMEESAWSLSGAAREAPEEFTPPWRVTVPALQFSEYDDWSEVVGLMAPLYKDDFLPSTLIDEIDRLASVHQKPAVRAAEWLRLVQKELRYFALSLDEGGWIPRKVETIWSSRFGDCKDATQLYVAGARRLGLDACAALCSTTHGRALKEFLPSPTLFNHCIVRLRLDGRTFWLDPTMQKQGGNLRGIYQPNSGWALALDKGNGDLELLGDDEPLHFLNVEEEVRFGRRRNEPAQFSRQTEYYSGSADGMRSRFANEGTGEYSKRALLQLQGLWPEIKESAPITVQDDLEGNCLTTILNYEIPNCWKADQKKFVMFEIADVNVVNELAPLKGKQRKNDIFLGRPRKVTRRVRLHMPRRWAGAGWVTREDASQLSYFNRFEILGRTTINTRELLVSGWSAPPDQEDGYGRVVAGLQQSVLRIRAKSWFGRIWPVGWPFAGASWQRFFAVSFFIFVLIQVISALLRR